MQSDSLKCTELLMPALCRRALRYDCAQNYISIAQLKETVVRWLNFDSLSHILVAIVSEKAIQSAFCGRQLINIVGIAPHQFGEIGERHKASLMCN